MTKNVYLSLLWLCCSLLTACGFHLRGTVSIAPDYLPIGIESESGQIRLTPVLTQTLRGAGLEIVDASVAKSVLRLAGERYIKKLLTVATSGESQTYSLQYVVGFQIQRRRDLEQETGEVGNAAGGDSDKQTKPHEDTPEKAQDSTNKDTDMLSRTITVSRSFQFEKKAVLSSASEETTIKNEMLKDAAQQILRRLNYL